MADELVLLDSNILIRWLQPRDPAFSVIEESIAQFAHEGSILCYTSQNLAEFWNVLTRPADRNGYGLTPIQADLHAQQVERTLNKSDFVRFEDIEAVHPHDVLQSP